MRILVTGATGFAGEHLIDLLRSREPESLIVGTFHTHPPASEPPRQDRLRYVCCDLVSGGGAAITGLIREIVPDRIYHLAAASFGGAVDRDAVFRANVDGTGYVVNAAAAYAPRCRILFASTGYVYGNCPGDLTAREDRALPPLETLPVYAQSKIRAEELVSRIDSCVIARAFNHTGPGQTTTFSVPSFACQIAQVESKLIDGMRVGNLEAVRDFLDVRDVVRAYYELAEHGTGGETYNVCSGVGRSMSAVLDTLIGMADVPITVFTDPERMRPADIARSVGDGSRLRSAVEWQPEITFERTLSDTLAFFRSSIRENTAHAAGIDLR